MAKTARHLRLAVRFRSLFGAALASLLLAAIGVGSAAAQTIALVPDRLIDGRSADARANAVVLIEGERIAAVGDRSMIPADATVIELPGTSLMPGMINAHEHPLMYESDYQNAHLQGSSARKALMGLAGAQQHLLAGWTSIRVAGDADVFYAAQDLRKVIDAGIFLGPRLSGAGHYLSITGGGGDINYLSPEQEVIADGLVVDGPEEIRKAVRREIKYGSDWIKLLVTGAYMSVGDNPRNIAFSPEELRAAVEEANRLGTIEAGKLADIIAVVGNPLENLKALEDVSFVMIGGAIVKRPGRSESLSALLIGNQQP